VCECDEEHGQQQVACQHQELVSIGKYNTHNTTVTYKFTVLHLL